MSRGFTYTSKNEVAAAVDPLQPADWPADWSFPGPPSPPGQANVFAGGPTPIYLPAMTGSGTAVVTSSCAPLSPLVEYKPGDFTGIPTWIDCVSAKNLGVVGVPAPVFNVGGPVTFSSGGGTLSTALNIGGSAGAYTCYLKIKLTTWSFLYDILQLLDGVDTWSLVLHNVSPRVTLDKNGTQDATNDAGFSAIPSAELKLAIAFDGSSSYIHFDGASSTSMTSSYSPGAVQTLILGGSGSTPGMEIDHCIVYNAAHTAGNRTTVFAYM